MADNPEIPQYAPVPPATNDNCQVSGNNGANIISPPSGGGSGKDAEVLAGFSMQVNDLSDINTDRFEVNYDPYDPVAVNLAIVAKEASVVKANPVLSGTLIDEVNCTWSYNAERDGDINGQTLVNTAAGANPTLLPTDRAYDYIGQTILADAIITVTGQDTRSNDSDAESILFGNYLAVGVSDPSLLLRSPSEAQTIFDNLVTKDVARTQAGYSFNAFGTQTEYMVIAHPESWGESEFTKGSFTGGYKRIYFVNRGGMDMFVDEILGGDVNQNIIIDNGKNGFTENYFFYMSEFPARTADKPTIISKA